VAQDGASAKARGAEALAAREAAAAREAEARLASLEAENAKLGQTQLELATRNMELEEELGRARDEARDLAGKSREAAVFEQALGDMRRLLEQEAEAKNAAEEELENLSSLQRKLKLTWVPKSAVTSCVGCGERFRAFGSRTKQHCHYCGRVMCKPCSGQSLPIPELGYREKVRVCNNCYGILCDEHLEADGGAGSDGGGGGAFEDDGDEDEEL
jgi:ribosomal protein S27E